MMNQYHKDNKHQGTPKGIMNDKESPNSPHSALFRLKKTSHVIRPASHIVAPIPDRMT